MASTRCFTSLITVIAFFGLVTLSFGAQTLTAVKIENAPVIDGMASDSAWNEADYIVTHDPIANIDIKLKAVYTTENIFFLVQFSDPDESRLHKPLVWNTKEELYENGPDREDCFVLKWAMDAAIKDLSVRADHPYMADVWFWKANRTDPVGYADDKYQLLSGSKVPKSKKIKSHSGQSTYLQRRGDEGESAYKASLLIEYQGDNLQQFINRKPSGSRADVKAKGTWNDDKWCIEFSRKLNTNHSDDIQFDLSKEYLFGVSRYEIAGRKKNPKLTQPLYGSGDVSEKLLLNFKP